MTVRLLTPADYFKAFPKARCVYAAQAFNRVTAPNAEAVRCFAAFDEKGKPRLGIIAGYRHGQWHAPYSAPFAEIAYDKPQQLERIYDFISELTDTLGATFQLTLAPDFYDPLMLPKLTGILSNYAKEKWVDFDYYYPLAEFGRYAETLDHSSRKNLRRAMALPYEFSVTDDIERTYEIIRVNRSSHGYPLAMTLEQVKATVDVVPAQCMVLSLNGEDVAAALVYHAAPSIAQVIYWGDIPGHAENRPMNMLAYHVFRHYHTKGFSIVDIGPSSTKGIPNTGLCRFKESIGCHVALRPTMIF